VPTLTWRARRGAPLRRLPPRAPPLRSENTETPLLTSTAEPLPLPLPLSLPLRVDAHWLPPP
jgi:hypothetical protein